MARLRRAARALLRCLDPKPARLELFLAAVRVGDDGDTELRFFTFPAVAEGESR